MLSVINTGLIHVFEVAEARKMGLRSSATHEGVNHFEEEKWINAIIA